MLTFLDLGLVGELDSGRRLQLLGLMWSLRQRDANGLATHPGSLRAQWPR